MTYVQSFVPAEAPQMKEVDDDQILMGLAGGAPHPTGALPHLRSSGGDGGDDGDSDDLFCSGVRFKCYTLHLSSTELNTQCVPKITSS